jgi:hypothetical protein
MRSIRLTTAIAIVAAATLLALVPAAAFAGHKRQLTSHTGACRIRLNVAPHLLYARDSALAWGRLSSCPGGEDANQTVTLDQYTLGAPGGFTAIGTTTTNALGGYELSTGALTNNGLFYAVADGATSEQKTVRVVAEVTLSGPAEGQLSAGIQTGRPNRVRFTGAVYPYDEGARVVLQRQNALTGDEWHRIGRGIVGPEGKFTIAHTFIVPGDANIRVLIRSSHRNVASPSNELNYEISQAQNPKLTIESLTDPITYGQSVTIHGTTAPSTLLTLMARTVRQGAYAPVAQVHSDGGGSYAFPVQSPVNSTFYEVQGGGLTSAVLFEGVGDVLTATMSPAVTSIPAGQALTFSGSVSPEHSDHAIYLESLNAAGKFHVVERSTIVGSTYSITHYVYTEGMDVFRVKVPGDPQNGGAASQTFTVQVTPPTSASALTPEPPGNSTLPSEGEV